MYKVIFTDDEILTREAVAKNTPWEDAGFALAGTAQNGREAIALIERERPELLITDICMPVMDGLELAAYVREHFPAMKVVILSGYDEFDYAKKALQYGVSEYILKPITSAELEEVLRKMAQQLRSEGERRSQLEKLRRDQEESRPLLRERYLGRVLEGRESGDLEGRLAELGVSLRGGAQAVLLLGAADDGDWKEAQPEVSPELMRFMVGNAAQELLADEEETLLFHGPGEQCVIVVARQDERALREAVRRVAGRIMEAVAAYMHVELCVSAGVCVGGPSEWRRSYESARYAQEFLYLSDDGLLFGEDYQRERDGVPTTPWSERLARAVRGGRREELTETVHSFFEALRAARCERRRLWLCVQNCALAVTVTLEERGALTAGEIAAAQGLLNGIGECRHLSQMETCFSLFGQRLQEAVAAREGGAGQSITRRALDYIGSHYGDADVSLNAVCEALAVSVSYFSQIFKSEAKETFVEALTRVRMEKARELLETTSLKSYEVAERVGYGDPHYFSAAFKKFFGATPTEYAKRRRAERA